MTVLKSWTEKKPKTTWLLTASSRSGSRRSSARSRRSMIPTTSKRATHHQLTSFRQPISLLLINSSLITLRLKHIFHNHSRNHVALNLPKGKRRQTLVIKIYYYKLILLSKIISMHRIPLRYRTYSFKWNSLDYPARMDAIQIVRRV